MEVMAEQGAYLLHAFDRLALIARIVITLCQVQQDFRVTEDGNPFITGRALVVFLAVHIATLVGVEKVRAVVALDTIGRRDAVDVVHDRDLSCLMIEIADRMGLAVRLVALAHRDREDILGSQGIRRVEHRGD